MAKNRHPPFNLGFRFGALDKDLKVLFLSNLVGSFGDGLYAYILPYYMTDALKFSPVEIGTLYATTGLFSAMTLIVAGMLADKYDRKKIMIAGWIAWLPAPLIFSYAENWLQMLPGMALWGVWLGGPTTTAYIITKAKKEKLTLTFTAISSSWSVGYIFSPALGGYLARTISMRIVFYSAFLLYGSASLLLFFVRSQYAKNLTQNVMEKPPSIFSMLKTRKIIVLSLFLGITMFAVMLFRPFVPRFVADVYHYGDFEIGLLGSFSFFGSAVLGILLGKFGDKWRKSYALASALVLGASSLILLLLFGDFYLLIITHFLIGASYLAWPLMNAIIGPFAPESIRALWLAIPQTVGIFSLIVAPYLGGVLYEWSPYYPFVLGTVVAFFLALLTFSANFEG